MKGGGELYVRYSQMYSHIVPFPLPVCVMGQVSSAPRSLFMYRCSVRRTVSPACLFCLTACPSYDIWM